MIVDTKEDVVNEVVEKKWEGFAVGNPTAHEQSYKAGYRSGLAAAPPVSLPDRETLGLLLDEAMATLAQHDRVWANTSSNPLPTSGVSAALRKVIPVLAALSTQPAAGCALDEENRLIAKPHDPYPIKVRNKAGAWVTTLPMSALGYHMGHEVQQFAPDAEFCQRPDHYFAALDHISIQPEVQA